MRLIRCLILCLAGYTNYIVVRPTSAFGADTKSPVSTPLKVDHILLEVSTNRFDCILPGFPRTSSQISEQRFVMLESDNVGVFLWSARWDWEKPRANGEREGLGMYPHFEVSDAAAIVDRARQAGYRIVQEPRKYDWGTEAFIADHDGYTWAFVSPRK